MRSFTPFLLAPSLWSFAPRARANGQMAWLGSEELHRSVGGAITSAFDAIMLPLIAAIVLILFGVIYGTTRFIEWLFSNGGGSPRPVISTCMALALFCLFFWAFAASTGLPGVAGLVIGASAGLPPAILILVIEVVRTRRSAKPGTS